MHNACDGMVARVSWALGQAIGLEKFFYVGRRKPLAFLLMTLTLARYFEIWNLRKRLGSWFQCVEVRFRHRFDVSARPMTINAAGDTGNSWNSPSARLVAIRNRDETRNEKTPQAGNWLPQYDLLGESISVMLFLRISHCHAVF